MVPTKRKGAGAPLIRILQARNLARIPWLLHGFSTRAGGVSKCYGGGALNLGETPQDRPAVVKRNRKLFLESLGASGLPVISLRQIHSDLIWSVIRESQTKPLANLPVISGDGLITNSAGILLAVRTADCYPILLVDVRQRAVAVLHAGWKGTLRRIAEKGVGEMRRCFNSSPRDLRAAIGPGIHSCCYRVGEEVRELFQSQFSYADSLFTVTRESDPVRERYPLLFMTARPPGHLERVLPVSVRLDLAEANRRQLVSAGIEHRHISISPLCTSCRADMLFSHRAEKGDTGRMMAVIGIRSSPEL
jgi:polyphenol oxidase